MIDTVNQAQLDYLIKRVTKRVSTLQEEKALDALANAAVGKTVRLSNLKLKYMNNRTGTIVEVLDTKIRVKVIRPHPRQLRRFGESGEITVPASCCTVLD